MATSSQDNHPIHHNMSSANSANIPSPIPSSFTVDMDAAEPLPIRSSAETLVVYQQEPLSIPVVIAAISTEFSELQLSPCSVCAALKGHRTPAREELLLIAQGLAGVAQKNQEVGCDYQKQLEVLKQQGEDLAKHKAHVAHLEATYKHWKEDMDWRDTEWEWESQGPEGYEENKGYISDFFIPISNGDHTMHVLAPYIKMDRLYCLGTISIDKPIYRHKLFPPQHITIEEEGEFPHWFFEGLANNSTYITMYNYSWTQKDWGITAEFQHYHDMHAKITALVAEQRSVAAAIEAAQVQLDQSQWHLLGSHTYEWYQLFHTLHEGPYIDPKSKRKFTSIPGSSRHGVARPWSGGNVTGWLAQGQENCWKGGVSVFDPQVW